MRTVAGAAPEHTVHENWNRYYDPVVGQYSSPEPMLHDPSFVELVAGGGITLPTYAYAGNNPVAFLDPTGLHHICSAAEKMLGKADRVDSFGTWCPDRNEPNQPSGGAGAAVPKKPGGGQGSSDADTCGEGGHSCEAVRQKCIEEATKTLPTGEYSGDKYYKVLKDCLRANGCGYMK